MADILDKLIDTLREQMPDMPADRLRVLEVRMRSEHGGCEAGYIAKRPALQRAVQLGHQLQAGVPVGQAIQAVGISRRHGSRILNRPLTTRAR